MKKAVLHDGRTLEFPDTHTPEQIKAHVKGLLQKEHSDKKDKEEALRVKKEQKEDAKHREAVEATKDVAASMVSSMGKLGAHLNQSSIGIQKLGGKLDSVERIGDAVVELANNINSLEKTIHSSVDAIIKVLKSPRKIVTTAKGKPIGMQIGDE